MPNSIVITSSDGTQRDLVKSRGPGRMRARCASEGWPKRHKMGALCAALRLAEKARQDLSKTPANTPHRGWKLHQNLLRVAEEVLRVGSPEGLRGTCLTRHPWVLWWFSLEERAACFGWDLDEKVNLHREEVGELIQAAMELYQIRLTAEQAVEMVIDRIDLEQG